jgi:hypothetical protein
MQAKSRITIAPLILPLVGAQPTGILVDGQELAVVNFGQSVTCDVSPDVRQVDLLLHGIINRQSNTVVAHIGEGEQVALTER